MEKFQFSLQGALNVRTRQVEIEEASLERLLAERAQIDIQIAGLAVSRTEAESAVLGTRCEPVALHNLDHYRNWTVRRKAELQKEAAAADGRVEEQRRKVQAARTNCRLLEKLRAKALSEWQKQWDRQQEELAAENFLANWSRGARLKS